MGLQVVELAHPKFAYLERNEEKKLLFNFKTQLKNGINDPTLPQISNQ